MQTQLWTKTAEKQQTLNEAIKEPDKKMAKLEKFSKI